MSGVGGSGRPAALLRRLSDRAKGLVLLVIGTASVGAGLFARLAWPAIWGWVTMVTCALAAALGWFALLYLRGRGEAARSTKVALPGSVPALTTAGEIGQWLNLSNVFLASCRIATGWVFWWGAEQKNPWNRWGWLGWWFDQIVTYHPHPWFVDLVRSSAIPNLDRVGWTQFVIEVAVATMLMLGVFGRLGGLAGAGWGAFIYYGAWGNPAEPFWIYHLIFFAPLAMAGTRAGRALGVDALLAPRLVVREGRLWRLLHSLT